MTDVMAISDHIRTYAVIPAAGRGLRLAEDSSLPKQYTIVCGKPLIYHTINAFLRIKWIDKLIVVFDAENSKLMEEIVGSIGH
ncbi:unnamed protein product, partial [Medioppia subpectinata]